MFMQSKLNSVLISYLKATIIMNKVASLSLLCFQEKDPAETWNWSFKEYRHKYALLNRWCLNLRELE